ncbi:MAG: thioesterase family protein [Thermofilum sp.]|nr:thioesterase family protein [Thermofilum sp.]
MSEFELRPGFGCVKVFAVGDEHVAKHVGSGDVEVLSTPSMIAFMERVAMECVQVFLPEGYTTVGTAVEVRHLNPAPKGAEVEVAAKLVEVEGRRLKFEVEARWGSVLVGKGVHERFIVERAKFLEKVRELARKAGESGAP